MWRPVIRQAPGIYHGYIARLGVPYLVGGVRLVVLWLVDWRGRPTVAVREVPD